MADSFERFSGFPRVIGAVDGCHIPIRTPSQYPQSYLNRLRSHSIILQVINYASVNSTSAHLCSVSLSRWWAICATCGDPQEFDTRGLTWQMRKYAFCIQQMQSGLAL